MQQFLQLVTAAAILLHATLGCCAHEVHHVSGYIVSDHVVASHNCRHHHDALDVADHESHDHKFSQPAKEHANPQGSQPSTPLSCTHTRCEWPAPELRTDGETLSLEFSGDVASYANSFAASLFERSKTVLTNSANLSLSALPVRSHLAHSVLQI